MTASCLHALPLCYGVGASYPVRLSIQVRRILAGDEELLAKLSKALLESYVDDNKEAKWCPSTPHCGNAIKVRRRPGKRRASPHIEGLFA